VVNHKYRLSASVCKVKIRKSVCGGARDRNAGVSPAGSARVLAAAVLGKMSVWRVGGGTHAWPAGEDASAPSRNLRHMLIVMLRDDLLQRITIDPNVCFGKPCIRGTRIWVEVIIENLAAGVSEREILHAYPALTADDINAATTYAAEGTRH